MLTHAVVMRNPLQLHSIRSLVQVSNLTCVLRLPSTVRDQQQKKKGGKGGGGGGGAA